MHVFKSHRSLVTFRKNCHIATENVVSFLHKVELRTDSPLPVMCRLLQFIYQYYKFKILLTKFLTLFPRLSQ